jgi:hypothetical protein
MPDSLDLPPRAINTADVTAQPAPKKRRHWGLIALLVLVVLPATAFALYTWSALSFVYSRGERSGFVQKLAKKGWVCQTWEGELAMANLPGAMPQIFYFTVRNDSLANVITSSMGKRVALSYQQHRGIPTTCFGDTQYFIVGVRTEAGTTG